MKMQMFFPGLKLYGFDEVSFLVVNIVDRIVASKVNQNIDILNATGTPQIYSTLFTSFSEILEIE